MSNPSPCKTGNRHPPSSSSSFHQSPKETLSAKKEMAAAATELKSVVTSPSLPQFFLCTSDGFTNFGQKKSQKLESSLKQSKARVIHTCHCNINFSKKEKKHLAKSIWHLIIKVGYLHVFDSYAKKTGKPTHEFPSSSSSFFSR